MTHGLGAHRNCSLPPLGMALGRHKEARPCLRTVCLAQRQKGFGSQGLLELTSAELGTPTLAWPPKGHA